MMRLDMSARSRRARTGALSADGSARSGRADLALTRLVAENQAELRRYFRMLARASLAGGALTASACASSFEPELYERPLCTPTGGLVLFDASAPGPDHDFLGAFQSGADSG